jgi:tRNA(Ile)-lysidine synthase
MIHLDGTPSERESTSRTVTGRFFASKEWCPRAMLSSKVIRTIERYGMLRPGDRVLVGLSGGADSVALTELLVELKPRLGVALVLAHLDHGLRAEAEEDESFCRSLAERLSLPFVSERIDVAGRARESKRSIEAEGRSARYQFLETQALRFGAQRIAVGHTLDDQAETFLLRLFRGSGGRGLGSIHPVKDGRVIRPLIEVRRREIEIYLDERSAAFREDRSNADPRFTRNRIRHEELPRLSSRYNPRLVETLARSASLLRDEEEWMEAETIKAFASLSSLSKDEIRLERRKLSRNPPALRRRLVRTAIERLRGLDDVSNRHVEDLLALAEEGQSGQELHLPGLVVELVFDQVRFRIVSTPRAQKARERGYNGFEYRLSIPARVRIPECLGTLSARVAEPNRERPNGQVPNGQEGPEGRVFAGTGEVDYPPCGNAVIVGFDGRLPELEVRSPRPGDRFHPLGAPGSKPLSRYLMERKISRDSRSRVPLVVRRASSADSAEEILWVVGHGVSEASRVSAGSSRLSFRWVTP